MSKVFRLSCTVTVSAYTEVEADSLAAAIEEAGSRDVQISGFGFQEDEAWIIEEPDGEPNNIHEEV